MHERDEKRGEDEVEGEVLVSALLLNLRLEDFLGHFFTQRLQLPRRISPLCPPLFASASPGFSMPLCHRDSQHTSTTPRGAVQVHVLKHQRAAEKDATKKMRPGRRGPLTCERASDPKPTQQQRKCASATPSVSPGEAISKIAPRHIYNGGNGGKPRERQEGASGEWQDGAAYLMHHHALSRNTYVKFLFRSCASRRQKANLGVHLCTRAKSIHLQDNPADSPLGQDGASSARVAQG